MVKRKDRDRFLDTFLSMLKSKFFTHTPFFLAHAITYACNSRCKTCTYWQMSHKANQDLSTEAVFNLLDDAYDCGMRGYYLFGGEPTVRKDIGQVVDYAKSKGFVTTMNTNGSLLAEKAGALRNLDFAFVSLDYFNGYHDSIRGRQGSFREVMDGIEQIRRVGNTTVTLVTTISSLNFDAIDPMAKLARDLHVGISYNSVEPTVQSSFEEGRTDSPMHNYGLTDAQLQLFYRKLLQLKREGYPLMETAYVLRHFVEGRHWLCQFPKMFVYVSADNKIFNCTYDHTYDLNRGSFKDYFSSSLYKNQVAKARNCNICIRTCVRGYSYAYDLNPQNFFCLLQDAKILVQQT
ncbi:MAG: radical SAM protein [Candidatus Bathyarchaeota archaeon]|nr:radical SAM protein [Candidatus Bathyarchaeota archaeon]